MATWPTGCTAPASHSPPAALGLPGKECTSHRISIEQSQLPGYMFYPLLVINLRISIIPAPKDQRSIEGSVQQ